MPSFTEVGYSKDEMRDIFQALDYQAANDGTLTAGEVEALEQISAIIKDMRQQVIDFDTANTTDTNPASIWRVTVGSF